MGDSDVPLAQAELAMLVLYMLLAIRAREERVKRLETREQRPVRLASATSMSL